MKLYNGLKMLSILTYCLIMLKGEMISLPFIFFLSISLFADFGSLRQLSAILAFVGLISTIILTGRQKTKRTLLLEIIVFILLLFPLLERMTSAPISLFNYTAFIMPGISFIILYILSLFFSYKNFRQIKHRTSNVVHRT
jgi:hypothetical protein